MELEQEEKKISTSESHQYLTFFMNHEEYGVDILSVVEIRGWEKVTPLPSAPEFIKGVINLRGTIIPIMDLRSLFSIEEKEKTTETVIIVLQHYQENKKKLMGIVVDAVSEVYSILGEEVREAPEIGNSIGREYINGLVNIQEEDQNKMLILLNVETLLSEEGV